MHVSQLFRQAPDSADLWSIRVAFGGAGSGESLLHVSHLLDAVRFRPDSTPDPRALLLRVAAHVHDIAWLSHFLLRYCETLKVHGLASADDAGNAEAAKEELAEAVSSWRSRRLLDDFDPDWSLIGTAKALEPAALAEWALQVMRLAVPVLSRLGRDFAADLAGPVTQISGRSIDPVQLQAGLSEIEGEMLEELSAREWESSAENVALIEAALPGSNRQDSLTPLHQADPGRLF